MIELKSVSKKYIKSYYTIYNINAKFNRNSLIVDNDYLACCLFRLISKIDTGYEGEIFVNEKNLKKIKDKNLNICYLPQYPLLFKNKSIYKNLEFPLKLRKFKKSEISKIIEKALYKFNFNINDKINKLNNSQQKLIGLIRGSLWQPSYMLIENFFEDLSKEYYNLAVDTITELAKTNIIIACEKSDIHFSCFDGFERIKLNNEQVNK